MLGVSVQQGEHSSVQDAQAAMRLYTMFRKDWEKDSNKRKNKYLSRTSNTDSCGATNHQGIDKQNKKEGKHEDGKMLTVSIGLKRNNQLEYEDSD